MGGEQYMFEVGFNYHAFLGLVIMNESNPDVKADLLATLERKDIKRMQYPLKKSNLAVGAIEIAFE